MTQRLFMFGFVTLSFLASGIAAAQSVVEEAPAAAEKPAPYDEQLARLSEILGSLHYLRNLCNGDEEPGWREAAQKLLDTETASEPARRARLVAAFNRGYRSFAATHSVCTPAAIAAEEQYRAEGATLAVEITGRYGN
ncbi:TIGR02301 family protein [Ciceribacter sp. L1K22]|uniref:TIGR02301 family protein n=1 Tax=Ciceribacter sp. L1K22 TaxID=2820275 RepID=UPI001ABEE319|nr:TIGR02301 family protein [Ciceribacter sp. L1K22]MBO3759645.1 TIGR02301 family protein [Ciceribacter sp. L1K22]